MDDKTIGQRLKTLRVLMGLSQEEFAKRTGESQRTISNAENDARDTKKGFLLALQKEFNVNTNWLLTGQGEMFLPKEGKSREGVSEPIEPYKGFIPSVVIPVLARVPAGFPEEILRDEVIEYICVPDVPKKSYAIIVKGESMAPTIKEGDYAIFLPAHDVINGDIVITQNGWGETFIKRYRRRKNKHFLTSDNPEYPTIEIKDTDKIIGKVIKIWRNINF
jgi:phage repressor protein C with HTH and peptisase S24 domain